MCKQALKQPEHVQNEFVAVDRGKMQTNPDYVQGLFGLFVSRKTAHINDNHWQTGGVEGVGDGAQVLLQLDHVTGC